MGIMVAGSLEFQVRNQAQRLLPYLLVGITLRLHYLNLIARAIVAVTRGIGNGRILQGVGGNLVGRLQGESFICPLRDLAVFLDDATQNIIAV